MAALVAANAVRLGRVSARGQGGGGLGRRADARYVHVRGRRPCPLCSIARQARRSLGEMKYVSEFLTR